MRSNIGRGLVFHVNELERLGGVRRGLARRLPSLLASGASPARPRGDPAKDVAITPIPVVGGAPSMKLDKITAVLAALALASLCFAQRVSAQSRPEHHLVIQR